MASRDVNSSYNRCFVHRLISAFIAAVGALFPVASISLSRSLPYVSRLPYSNANDLDRR
jgi:hypothetical protein